MTQINEKYLRIKMLRQNLHQNIRLEQHEIRFRMMTLKYTEVYYRTIKRAFDILASGTALILLFPLMLLIALAIRLNSPGPVIFSQTRVGLYGRKFRFYKFRSMYTDAAVRRSSLQQQNQSSDGIIFKMRNDPRITPVGQFLRRTSLDELPQLFNVLIGDMSLVGPRPPIPEEVLQYTVAQHKRLNIPPGITCIWQVSGRSELPFKMQVVLDRRYIAGCNLRMDFMILLKTIPAILSGKGAW